MDTSAMCVRRLPLPRADASSLQVPITLAGCYVAASTSSVRSRTHSAGTQAGGPLNYAVTMAA